MVCEIRIFGVKFPIVQFYNIECILQTNILIGLQFYMGS